MEYQVHEFIKLTNGYLLRDSYVLKSIPSLIRFWVTWFRGSVNTLDAILMQIIKWNNESPIVIDHADALYDALFIVMPVDESISHQGTKINRITKDANELEFRFESNMFVRIHRDGNKVKISIVQGVNVLMTIFDRSGNPEYTDGDGNLNLLFCLTKAQSAMQSYLELQGETK